MIQVNKVETQMTRAKVGSKMHDGSSHTVASNRLSHGLSSRAIAEARVQQVKDLADALLGDAPKTYAVLDVAFSLAGTILHLAAVRRAKNALLTEGIVKLHIPEKIKISSLPPTYENPTGGSITAESSQQVVDEIVASIVQDVLRDPDNVKTFVRLYEYERKAISRRNRLLVRCDYLVFEARRKQREIEAAKSSQSSHRREQGRRSR
jgi:hypothetical protein